MTIDPACPNSQLRLFPFAPRNDDVYICVCVCSPSCVLLWLRVRLCCVANQYSAARPRLFAKLVGRVPACRAKP